jgi:hypothetical protein
MLFRRQTLDGIQAGKISLAFRRWTRPSVRAGGTLKTRIGVLAIESVETVSVADITERDARLAGSVSRQALVDELGYRKDGSLFRVKFRLAGPDPRIKLRQRAKLRRDELVELKQKLDRLDRASPTGEWTLRFLHLIRDNPARRAGDLADIEGLIKAKFKINVRKLKNLGLTESLEIGYRLSPRGRAYLRWLESLSD